MATMLSAPEPRSEPRSGSRPVDLRGPLSTLASMLASKSVAMSVGAAARPDAAGLLVDGPALLLIHDGTVTCCTSCAKRLPDVDGRKEPLRLCLISRLTRDKRDALLLPASLSPCAQDTQAYW